MIVKKKLILKSEDGELKAEMKVKFVGCAKELWARWVGAWGSLDAIAADHVLTCLNDED